jgi:hypothetical protein
MEDKQIWLETKRHFESTAMEHEVEKSNYEETLNNLLEEKGNWKKHQKVLEDKIQNLTNECKETKEKYQDLLNQMKRLQKENQEIECKYSHLEHEYQETIEEMNDEFEKKVEEWRSMEQDYEFMIQRYQDAELDNEMKIQDLKYTLNSEKDDLEEKYKETLEKKEEEWEDRVKNLNDIYDNEFIQYKEHFKNKEQKLEKEKENLEQTLRCEIEVLKKENIQLEQVKNNINIEWNNRESTLISQIESLALDNQRLERQWKEEKKNNEKKIEERDQHLKTIAEMETNQKVLQDIINKKETQEKESDFIEPQGIRQRRCSTIETLDDGSYPIKKQKLEHPHVVTMDKNHHEKKNESTQVTKMDIDHHVIDIEPMNVEVDNMNVDNMNVDDDNFFLHISGLLTTPHIDKNKKLEKKLKEYELEIQSLKERNQEYLNKIYSYESNSILDLNRKIRSGIPVRFFPYHTNHTISNTSHVHSLDFELH